jgi:hypothetical protein
MARAINFPFTFRGNGTLVDTEDTAKIYVDRNFLIFCHQRRSTPYASRVWSIL